MNPKVSKGENADSAVPPGPKVRQVDVFVREYAGAYHARAGTGLKAKLASSTNHARYAALNAAVKFFGPGVTADDLALATVVHGSSARPWHYCAVVNEDLHSALVGKGRAL